MFVWVVDKSLVTWRNWNSVRASLMVPCLCVSVYLVATVWMWSRAVYSVWTWTQSLLSSLPLRCLENLHFCSSSKVEIWLSIFFCMKTAVCLPSHLLACFIFPACFPVVKPVCKMLGLSIFLQESICYLGEIVKMIVADHKRSPEVRSEHE